MEAHYEASIYADHGIIHIQIKLIMPYEEEYDHGKYDDDMREYQEQEHEYRCARRDMDQGIEPDCEY